MNMKSAQILTGVMAFALMLVVAPATVEAAQLSSVKDELNETQPSLEAQHKFTFKAGATHLLQGFQFKFCTTPSGVNGDGSCVTPGGLGTTLTEKGSLQNLTQDNWSLSNWINGTMQLTTGSAENISEGGTVVIPINKVTNPSMGGCNGNAGASADTCYVRIATSTTTTFGTPADTGIASFTIVAAVNVTSRVDPTFTFVVTGVNNGVTTNGVTTSVSSAFNTLPFGNLTAGYAKYAAHQLKVTTNSYSGYTITMRMLNPMTGVYTANNIDPFARAGATWSTPQLWQSPTGGNANDNTGWIGANTNDADLTDFTSAEFGPVDATEHTVMRGNGTDDGQQGVYVTYAIEANVYQPADSYTGTLVYNALPTY